MFYDRYHYDTGTTPTYSSGESDTSAVDAWVDLYYPGPEPEPEPKPAPPWARWFDVFRVFDEREYIQATPRSYAAAWEPANCSSLAQRRRWKRKRRLQRILKA